MLNYIGKHFNPSGAIDFLGYIFDLIDIKQGADKPVATLQARFSRVFALLKMGSVDIGSGLQVGFMLRSLRSCYSAVVTDYQLGRHSVPSATLQTVVKHCTAFNKDPWTGPVGRDSCPVHSPLANTTSASPGEPSVTYNAMEHISFNYHLSRQRKSLSNLANKCLICPNSAQGNKHTAEKCPILKKLGMKLKKCLAADNSKESAVRVASNASTAFTPAPPPAPPSDGGSTIVPGACTAITEVGMHESGDEFDYKGKYEGAFYAGSNKPSKNVSLYLSVPHSCSHMSLEIINFASTTSQSFPIENHARMAVNPKDVTTIFLPKHVMVLLNKPPAHSIKTFSQAHRPCTSLLVADTGATNHMIPDKSMLISYRPCSGQQVRMGNNSFMPILGTGSAIISLNAKKPHP
jgi:hypothetical protein